MSRKPTLPGVDPEALASLARQFPASSVNTAAQEIAMPTFRSGVRANFTVTRSVPADSEKRLGRSLPHRQTAIA